jgi:predicted deacylase
MTVGTTEIENDENKEPPERTEKKQQTEATPRNVVLGASSDTQTGRSDIAQKIANDKVAPNPADVGQIPAHYSGTKLNPDSTKLIFGCTDDSKTTVKKLITVCMHGDEVCGMVAINELIQEGYFEKIFKSAGIASTRLSILLANPKGVQAKKRFIDVNLNRIFMESKLRRSGSITANPMDQDKVLRTQYEVTRVQQIADEIADCDVYIDIHSTSAKSYPFALPSNDPESEALASTFAVDFVIEKLVKSVRGTSIGWACALKKPAVCFECGQHQDRQTVEVAKTLIRRFVSGESEGTAKAVLTCSNNEVIRKGFKYVHVPQAFQKVSCNELLAIDEEVGEIRCGNPKGAYIIMPTANPILGEEAWFWGEVKESSEASETKQQEKQQIAMDNWKKINTLRKSFSGSSRQPQ